MNGDTYTKLWSSIITSTVWQEPLPTKVVWITMLALKDARGYVAASIPGLASVAGVTIEECEIAINKFLSPDKWSRTKEHEGRRIAEVDGGWMVLNHEKHRDGEDADQRREQLRLAAKRYRERRKSSSASSGSSSASYDESSESSHTDTETDTETDTKQVQEPSSSGIVPSEYEPDFETLLNRISRTPEADIRGWVAEIRVATQGMHGPAITPQQVGEAIRAFNANGAPTNFKLFKTYLRKTEVAAKPEAKTEVVRKLTNQKPPWEVKRDREANDQRLNKDPEVHRVVNSYKDRLGDAWWAEKIEEAKARERWVVPYTYELLMQTEKQNGAA